MGYVYNSSSRVVIVAGGDKQAYLKTNGNRGQFLFNLAMLLADKLDLPVNTDEHGRIEVILYGTVENAFNEIINLKAFDRSGKGIVSWLLAVWDVLKKYGLSEYLSLEDMLRLY